MHNSLSAIVRNGWKQDPECGASATTAARIPTHDGGEMTVTAYTMDPSDPTRAQVEVGSYMLGLDWARAMLNLVVHLTSMCGHAGLVNDDQTLRLTIAPGLDVTWYAYRSADDDSVPLVQFGNQLLDSDGLEDLQEALAAVLAVIDRPTDIVAGDLYRYSTSKLLHLRERLAPLTRDELERTVVMLHSTTNVHAFMDVVRIAEAEHDARPSTASPALPDVPHRRGCVLSTDHQGECQSLRQRVPVC
jgi:hypothetical protein